MDVRFELKSGAEVRALSLTPAGGPKILGYWLQRLSPLLTDPCAGPESTLEVMIDSTVGSGMVDNILTALQCMRLQGFLGRIRISFHLCKPPSLEPTNHAFLSSPHVLVDGVGRERQSLEEVKNWSPLLSLRAWTQLMTQYVHSTRSTRAALALRRYCGESLTGEAQVLLNAELLMQASSVSSAKAGREGREGALLLYAWVHWILNSKYPEATQKPPARLGDRLRCLLVDDEKVFWEPAFRAALRPLYEHLDLAAVSTQSEWESNWDGSKGRAGEAPDLAILDYYLWPSLTTKSLGADKVVGLQILQALGGVRREPYLVVAFSGTRRSLVLQRMEAAGADVALQKEGDLPEEVPGEELAQALRLCAREASHIGRLLLRLTFRLLSNGATWGDEIEALSAWRQARASQFLQQLIERNGAQSFDLSPAAVGEILNRVRMIWQVRLDDPDPGVNDLRSKNQAEIIAADPYSEWELLLSFLGSERFISSTVAEGSLVDAVNAHCQGVYSLFRRDLSQVPYLLSWFDAAQANGVLPDDSEAARLALIWLRIGSRRLRALNRAEHSSDVLCRLAFFRALSLDARWLVGLNDYIGNAEPQALESEIRKALTRQPEGFVTPIIAAEAGWKAKIASWERLEDPHLTITRRSDPIARFNLRTGELMEGSRHDVPKELLAAIVASLDAWRALWNDHYPHNPVLPNAPRKSAT